MTGVYGDVRDVTGVLVGSWSARLCVEPHDGGEVWEWLWFATPEPRWADVSIPRSPSSSGRIVVPAGTSAAGVASGVLARTAA